MEKKIDIENMEGKSWWKSIANSVSMITLPSGAFAVTAEPLMWWGWTLLGIGLIVQVAKYWSEE